MRLKMVMFNVYKGFVNWGIISLPAGRSGFGDGILRKRVLGLGFSGFQIFAFGSEPFGRILGERANSKWQCVI
jgi:hypothetical protein